MSQQPNLGGGPRDPNRMAPFSPPRQSFGGWILAASIAVIGLAVLERYNQRWAVMLAIMLLLGMLFAQPQAIGQITLLFKGG